MIKNKEQIQALLKKTGVHYTVLEQLPLSTLRHAQRGAFPNMRMTHIAPSIREASLKTPILSDLLCTRVGYQGPSPAHYIPRPSGSYDHILIYCTAGKGWLEMDNQQWQIEKNEAFLIPAHKAHSYGAATENPWSNYWLHFQGKQAKDYTSLLTPDPGSPVIRPDHCEDLTAAMEQLYRHMKEVHNRPNLVAASGALSRLLTLFQLRMHSAGKKNQSAEHRVDDSIDFMQNNLDSRLQLNELARIAGMSPNHYGALFMQRHQHSPIDYFNRLKVQKACELLLTSNQRVNEIAESLGFADPYYFSRLFKKIMGKSPRHYR